MFEPPATVIVSLPVPPKMTLLPPPVRDRVVAADSSCSIVVAVSRTPVTGSKVSVALSPMTTFVAAAGDDRVDAEAADDDVEARAAPVVIESSPPKPGASEVAVVSTLVPVRSA